MVAQNTQRLFALHWRAVSTPIGAPPRCAFSPDCAPEDAILLLNQSWSTFAGFASTGEKLFSGSAWPSHLYNPHFIGAIAWSPRGDRFIVGVHGDHFLFSRSGRRLAQGRPGGSALICWSPDGRRTASVNTQVIELRNADTGLWERELKAPQTLDRSIVALVWPRAHRLIALAEDGAALWFDPDQSAPIRRVELERHGQFSPDSLSRDGRKLALIAQDGRTSRLQICETLTGAEVCSSELPAPSDATWALAWSGDADHLAVAWMDEAHLQVQIRSSRTGQQLLTATEPFERQPFHHRRYPMELAMAWSPCHTVLAVISNAQLRLFSIPELSPPPALEIPGSAHKPGAVLVSVGQHGSGKTTLRNAICRQLGAPQRTDAFFTDYETSALRIRHIDADGSAGQLSMMRAQLRSAQIALVVVDTNQGAGALLRAQLEPARASRPSIVVFINTKDERDEEIISLVELEVRALLNELELGGDDVPVIRGSAQDDAQAMAALLQQLEAAAMRNRRNRVGTC